MPKPKNIIHLAIPGFVGLMLLEYAASKLHKREVYEGKDAATSIAMGLCNVALEGAAEGLHQAVYDWGYAHRLFDNRLRGPARIAALIVADDFFYYWFHRTSHEVRMFWAAHVNHHSSEHYNLSTALRQSWTTPLTKLPFTAASTLLGFTPNEVKAASNVNLLYQFWVHTELIDDLGPLEAILNTPSHHRVHHGSNLRYLDRNYAGMFIVWDRLFGTFEPEDRDEPVRYGILHNLDTHRLWDVAMHEWRDMLADARRAPRLRDKLAHLFRPPGWSRDGSSQTVAEMRDAAE